MSAKTLHATACSHCGDEIVGKPIINEDKLFCCNGCQVVYSIIQEAGLQDYYSVEEKGAFTLKNSSVDDFEFLDQKAIIEKLTKQISEDLAIANFILPQIHCSSCIWLLEKLYLIDKGVYRSNVDFISKTIEIRFNPQKISLRNLVLLLSQLGFKPNLSDQKSRSANDGLGIKIAVAGFAFGNIMLFSFPEYLGLQDAYFQRWFNWLNIVLSLPVLLYSGRDYLIAGYHALKYKSYDINFPLALGILVMFFVSLYEIFTGIGTGYIDSMAGLVFFLLIGKWYQRVSFDYLSFERDYKSYFPLAAYIIKEGVVKSIPIEEIKDGDELIIKSNQIIPVDGTLLSDSTMIDYSFVTGEEKPVVVLQGEKIHAGGKLKDKSINIKTIGTVQNAYLVSLWNNKELYQKDNHITFTDRLSRYFTLAIVLIAVASFIYWMTIDFHKAIMSFAAVLIVACPCAIALTSPFIYGNLLRLLSQNGIFMRNGAVLDKLLNINKVVFDKTGTVTSQKDNEIFYHGKVLSDEQKRMVHALTFQSIHPLSVALEKELRTNFIYEIENFKEEEGLGINGICNGHFIKIGSSKYLNLIIPNEGKTRVYIKIDEEYLGYFEYKNKYREGFSNVLSRLNIKNKGLAILSGDKNDEYKSIKGLVGFDLEMNFNKDPHQKMEYIKAQNKNHSTMMIGDGLNDAGALKAAHLGMVLAEDTNNFTPASDIIITSTQFEKIPNLFELALATKKSIIGAYVIAGLYNVIGLSFAVSGHLKPIVAAILMPLSSLTIVIYSLFISKKIYRYYFEKQANKSNY